MSNFRFIIVLCLFYLACSTNKKIAQKQIDAPTEIIQKAESGILFLTINFENNDDPVVTSAQSVFNMGKVKRESSYKEGDIKCELISQGNVIRTLYFNNPLNTSFEVYGDGGILERKDVKLEEASEVIRLNYSFEWSEMNVYHIIENSEQMLAQIKI